MKEGACPFLHGESLRGGLPPSHQIWRPVDPAGGAYDNDVKTRGGFRRLSSLAQSLSGPQSGLLSGFSTWSQSQSSGKSTALIL